MRKKDPGFRYCLFIALSYLAMKYLTRQIGCMLTELAVPKGSKTVYGILCFSRCVCSSCIYWGVGTFRLHSKRGYGLGDGL